MDVVLQLSDALAQELEFFLFCCRLALTLPL
jgi:hypothetical protein